MYITTLEELQIGLETAWGDGATPTVQPAGITDCRLVPKVEATQLTDKRGDTMPAHLGMVTRVFSEADLSGVLTYEDIHYWLDGMFGKVTPADDVYTYSGSMNWASPHPAIQTYNFVYGQTGAVYAASGMVMDRLDINGATGAPITFTSHFFGKAISDGALENLTITSVNPAMGADISLFIDDAGGTIGSTEIVAEAVTFAASIAPDRKPVWHLGSLQPDNYRHGKWGGSLRLGLELTAASKAILDDVLDNTTDPTGKLIRVKGEQGTLLLQLDFAGQLLEAPVLFTDNDGIVTVELSFVPFYDSDINSCWGALVNLSV
jgi:hypothetical protein